MFCETDVDSMQEEILVRQHTFLSDFKIELKCDTVYVYVGPWVSIVENLKIAEDTWF